MAKYTKAQQEEARERLLQWLRPGDTVHTVLNHVSRSGMSRTITPLKLVVNDAGRVDRIYLGRNAAVLLGLPDDGDQGVKIGGCGMDMGFALVYDLSHVLWPDGFNCLGDGCPASDHNNARRERCLICGAEVGETVAYTRKNHGYDFPVCSQACAVATWHHSSGGYALKQGWI